MNVELDTDDVYRICNALNSYAQELSKDAKARKKRGHTYQQIDVVLQEAEALLALSKRLIDEKNEDLLNDFNYVGSRHHY